MAGEIEIAFKRLVDQIETADLELIRIIGGVACFDKALPQEWFIPDPERYQVVVDKWAGWGLEARAKLLEIKRLFVLPPGPHNTDKKRVDVAFGVWGKVSVLLLANPTPPYLTPDYRKQIMDIKILAALVIAAATSEYDAGGGPDSDLKISYW